MHDLTGVGYKMADNKNDKKMFRIWRMTAYIIGVSSVLAGVLTSNMLIGLIGVGIGRRVPHSGYLQSDCWHFTS